MLGSQEKNLEPKVNVKFFTVDPYSVWVYRGVGPQDEKSSNLHITADSTGSIHKNARGEKFDPKKVRLGCGNLI